MATAGAKPLDCKLARVGYLKLEDDSCDYPEYTGLVVLPGDMLMVVDSDAYNTNAFKLRLCNCHDGKLLATSERLQVQPHDVCVFDESETQVAMTRLDGKIEILSFRYTARSAAIEQVRILDATTIFEYCHGVRALKSRKQLVVSGGKKDKNTQVNLICWGILSNNDGHVHAVHKICKSGGGCYASSSYLATSADDRMVFISCWTGAHYPDNNGVYAFDIMNSKQKFVYHHKDLTTPKGISVDREGFIYVCNLDPSSIHQLTVRGEPLTIHKVGMPPEPLAMYWKESQKQLYVTSRCSKEVWRYNRMLNDQQEDYTAPEVLVSVERKQSVAEKTSTGIEQRVVDKLQSNVETEMHPSVPVPEVSEDKQNVIYAKDKTPELHDKKDDILQEIEQSNIIAKVDKGESSVKTEMPPSGPSPEDSEDKKKEGLIQRLMHFLGLGHSQKKHDKHHNQGEHTVSEVLASDVRKQSVAEKTSSVKEQGVVNQGQSSVEREVPPSIQVPVTSDVDNQGSAIPVEILRMDDKSLQLYKEALQDGMVKVYNIRVMVIGQYGVGKTTLTKRLLGQHVDISERTSTEGIDIYKHCCKIALDTGEWIAQHEDSEQLFRLQRLVKLLTHETERPEVSNEQGDQTEVIYQREATEDLCDPVHYSDSDSDDDDTSASSSESDLEEEVDDTKNQQGESSSFKVNQISTANDSSNVNIEDGIRHVTSKVDATMELLQLVVEKADKLEKSLVEYAALAMWDFAGQYVFYTTHQTFLTCRAIYLLVTDLSQHITDFVKDDKSYFDAEGVKLCKVHDLVQVWLNLVHCCAQSFPTGTDSKPGNAVTSPAADTLLTSHGASTPVPSLDVGIPVTPPVILVGTHMDKIQQDKRQEVVNKYFQQICHILKDKPSLQHLVGFLAIDNTQLDPQLENLKKEIFQLASRQPYWGEELPANWLPLEEALMKLKASGIKVIPHSLVETLNQGGAVPIKTTEQLDLFFRFHHETGNILYFSVEGLRDWIVLDPKWLIDALKSLITAETFILNNYPAVRIMWFEFKETGKLTSQLIDAIWTEKNHKEFHDNKNHILLLMEKLNIIARPKLFTEDGKVKEEDYYLAPCMLQQATPKEIISPESNPEMENTSIICFVSTGKFLPSPVFHRLLVACLGQWPIATQKSKNLIYCGCCVFNLDPLHNLTLYFKDYVIFVQVTRMKIADTRLSSDLCSEARNFIFENLSKIIGNLGQSCQFEPHIQCPDSEVESVEGLIAVSLLQTYERVPCHSHDRSHTLASRDLLKFWYEDEEHSVAGSSAVPMPPPPAGDTDRFMRLTYLLVDVGSRVLRQLLNHHTVTPTCTLDQYLAKNRSTINSLLKRKVLHQSKMDILFPPNGGNTDIEDYDVTLLSALFNNIVPSLSQQEEGMIKCLREDRNKLYGHAKSCKMNAMEYQTCWNSITSTLTTLSQQCGDPSFQNEISQEIQQIQVSAIPTGSYLDILKNWFSTIETVKGSLEGEIHALKSRLEALELKKTDEESEEK